MAERARTVLELRVGPVSEPDLRVERVSGREGVSEPFVVDVAFEPRSGEPLALGDLLGAEAQLTIRRSDGPERFVHGFAAAAELAEVRAGRPAYRVRIVPRLALLAHRRRSRVFQRRSVPEIVKGVLGDGGVALRDALQGSYPARELCVQYRESDLELVSRLLEEEGICYFFEHADGAHTLVLADAPGAFVEIADPAVPYRRPEGEHDEHDEEHVRALARSDRIRTGKATLRDFDFVRPALDLTASASAKKPEGERFEWALGYADPSALKRLATARLEETRVAAATLEGESTCVRLFAGSVFEVTEHPDASFDGKLQVLRVELHATQKEAAGAEGAVAQGFRNRFFATPAGTAYRPLRRTPRPSIAGSQTAFVVGPSGEEVHPDSHGRIKVRFHWDREGPKDDGASCFVRVVQTWAGPGFGASFLPRVGQEVIVRFLDGDPDRPLVVGALYNGANPTPIDLPGTKTQATLRSDSSPGGGGSNELRFEDATGGEELFLHAQKDHLVEIERQKDQAVGAREDLSVGGDRSQEVVGSQRLVVRAMDGRRVDQHQTLEVAAARTTLVGASQTETVRGSETVTVGAVRSVMVGAESALAVGAAYQLAVGGALALTAGATLGVSSGGALTRTVGGESKELGGGTRDESTAKNATTRTGGDVTAQVGAAAAEGTGKDRVDDVGGKEEIECVEPVSWVGKKVTLEPQDELALVVGGKLLLSLKKSGDVTFAASSFAISADGALTFKGSQVKKEASAAAAQKAAQVQALKDVRLARAVATAKVKSASGKPLAGVRFKAELPDGSVVEGITDAAGNAAIPSSKEGEIKLSLPDQDADAWSAS